MNGFQVREQIVVVVVFLLGGGQGLVRVTPMSSFLICPKLNSFKLLRMSLSQATLMMIQ